MRSPRGALPGRFTRRHWDGVLVLVLLGGGLLIGASRVRSDLPVAATGAPQPPATQASAAPPISGLAPDGTPLALDALRGQVVLVNVWASWCAPCRAEMPAIEAVYGQYRAQGFTVLAVNQREAPATVTPFLAEHGLTFPVVLDQDGAISEAYRVQHLPSSFFVDRRGAIRAVYRGPLSRSVLVGTVEQLLQEAP